MEHRTLNFRSRYQLTIWLSAAVLLVASLLYGWALSQQFRERSLAELAAQSEQMRLVLNQHTERARHHVGAMQLSVTAALLTPDDGPDLRLPTRRDPTADPHAPWDALPELARKQLGSLFVHPELAGAPEPQTMDAVIAMLPGVVADHSQQKIYQWSYYYDAAERWSVLYPSLPKTELLKATNSADMGQALKVVYEAGGTHPMRLVGPLGNPKRGQVWTTPYVDAGGKGLMVSLLEPIYHEGSLLGAVGTDLTLGMLDASIQTIPTKLGRALVITPDGQLLADSGGALRERKQPLSLQELDKAIVRSATLFDHSGGKLHHGEMGRWISHELDGTPWRLVLWVSHAQLREATLQALQPYLLLEILFIALLLLLAWWQHHRFTRPAMALADYVDRVSRDARSPAPDVPAVWKPWFDQVAATAHERQDYLTQTQNYAGKLELMVSERTAALSRTQQELIQSEKLAALGSLVAGVAHELNTPIGNSVAVATALVDIRRGFVERMETGLTRMALSDFVSTVGEAGEILTKNLQRAADLVTSFKQISVDQSSHQRRVFDLKEVVGEVQVVMSPAMRKAHSVIQSKALDGIQFDSYPGALTQVLMILLSNAVTHAFVGRTDGVVMISARTDESGQATLSVADNGVGIPEENLSRVFEPFFTTRLGTGGSGLGLHILFNIVNGTLGGTVEVHSEPGQGTTFLLRLPLVAPAPKPVPQESREWGRRRE